MSPVLRIVAIGSPFGDDRLGWVAGKEVMRLCESRQWGDRVEVAVLDRPGTRLIDHMDRADRLLLIDAVRSSAPPGTLHHIRDCATLAVSGSLSSHGYGVAHTLALAQELGCLPSHVTVLGLEADEGIQESLSPAVLGALPILLQAVEIEISYALNTPQPGACHI